MTANAPDAENTQDVQVDDEERPGRTLSGWQTRVVAIGCVLVSAYVLFAVFQPPPQGSQFYLTVFLVAVLPLVFLSYGARLRSSSTRPSVVDWILAVVSLVVAGYPLLSFDAFLERQESATSLDVLAGLALILLILEAARRTTGWWLPAICLAFIAYAYYGGLLPGSFALTHIGFNVDEIITHIYMGTKGVYSVPLDVAATYIVLFTIYGAVLNLSGASRFFIDLSFAAFRRSRSAPGRTVTLAGFLLGTVSGSGTATTVSLGAVAWPVLKKAGYPKNEAGGVLAAAGIGAILSPPTLGAAAFIIAEMLRTSYLTVLVYAAVPTVLYYTGIILAIELESRRRPPRPVDVSSQSALRLLLRFGYHFLSLALIVVFMAFGLPPFRAVVYATIVQLVLSFLDPAHRMTPRRIARALADGTRGMLPVAAVCGAAGVIVGVVSLTSLGFDLSQEIVDFARWFGSNPTVSLAVTALLAAIAVGILGLAIPVTASFIISAVIIAPALMALDVARPEAFMFVFYYAVLSEVTPPTALAAVAASAITGGDAPATMWRTWKYALPAFLVPFAFVLTDNGSLLLAQGPIWQVLLAMVVSMVAVFALAVATSGRLREDINLVERLLAVVAALLLLYLQPITVAVGLGALLVACVVHCVRVRARE